MSEITPETEHLYRFLEHLGVEGEIQFDSGDQPVVVISNENFEQNRKAVLTWFTALKQSDCYSHLVERQRGTGQTLT